MTDNALLGVNHIWRIEHSYHMSKCNVPPYACDVNDNAERTGIRQNNNFPNEAPVFQQLLT